MTRHRVDFFLRSRRYSPEKLTSTTSRLYRKLNMEESPDMEEDESQSEGPVGAYVAANCETDKSGRIEVWLKDLGSPKSADGGDGGGSPTELSDEDSIKWSESDKPLSSEATRSDLLSTKLFEMHDSDSDRSNKTPSLYSSCASGDDEIVWLMLEREGHPTVDPSYLTPFPLAQICALNNKDKSNSQVYLIRKVKLRMFWEVVQKRRCGDDWFDEVHVTRSDGTRSQKIKYSVTFREEIRREVVGCGNMHIKLTLRSGEICNPHSHIPNLMWPC